MSNMNSSKQLIQGYDGEQQQPQEELQEPQSPAPEPSEETTRARPGAISICGINGDSEESDHSISNNELGNATAGRSAAVDHNNREGGEVIMDPSNNNAAITAATTTTIRAHLVDESEERLREQRLVDYEQQLADQARRIQALENLPAVRATPSMVVVLAEDEGENNDRDEDRTAMITSMPRKRAITYAISLFVVLMIVAGAVLAGILLPTVIKEENPSPISNPPTIVPTIHSLTSSPTASPTSDPTTHSPTSSPTGSPTSSPTNAPITAPATTTWEQLGSDLEGPGEGARAGEVVALSQDGQTLAVGAERFETNLGQVNVYEWNTVTNQWNAKGSPLTGTAGQYFGYSLDLSSDGNTMVVARAGAGQATVYEYNPFRRVWEVRDTIITTGAVSTSLSADASVVAFAQPLFDRVGKDSGLVLMHKFANGEWTRIDQEFLGAAEEDRYGSTIALSADGTTLAAGARKGGYVQIFRVNNTSGKWSQLGGNLLAKIPDDDYGFDVALSGDGNTLAVGVPFISQPYVQVYAYDSQARQWTEHGDFILGSSSSWFGLSVSLALDGKTLVVGAPLEGSGGVVRLYEFVGNTWKQVGPDLQGEREGDLWGHDVDISADGSIIAAGADANDDNSEFSGHARVFRVKK